MSDARIRELERCAAQGDDWARRGLLATRLRAGELSADRVRLAAWLGDPVAASVADCVPPADWESWARELATFEPEAGLRACVAAGHLSLTAWEGWEAAEFAPGQHIRLALDRAVRAWDDGAGELRADAVEALLEGERAVDGASHLLAFLEAEHGLDLSRGWRAHRAGLGALACARGILAHLDSDCPGGDDVGAAAMEVAVALGAARVREAICEALLPWALEGPSPLARSAGSPS